MFYLANQIEEFENTLNDNIYIFGMKNLSTLIIMCAFGVLFSCTNDKNEKLITDLNQEIISLKDSINSFLNEKNELGFNKKLVENFFQEVFGELKSDAVKKYVGEKYIQHDPEVEDGRDALIELAEKWAVGKSPQKLDIKRVFAEKDLVFIHTRNDDGVELSLMHVFRIENEKIVEHWMTIQKVPENPKNNNTMF